MPIKAVSQPAAPAEVTVLLNSVMLRHRGYLLIRGLLPGLERLLVAGCQYIIFGWLSSDWLNRPCFADLMSYERIGLLKKVSLNGSVKVTRLLGTFCRVKIWSI